MHKTDSFVSDTSYTHKIAVCATGLQKPQKEGHSSVWVLNGDVHLNDDGEPRFVLVPKESDASNDGQHKELLYSNAHTYFLYHPYIPHF